ncbi:N-acetyl-glucosamine-6-phosphate deacetylase [Paecilomyces lecythidis]
MFSPAAGKITAFKNGEIISDGRIVAKELYIDGTSGHILDGFEFPEGERVVEDTTVDLRGRILCPGFIDVQFNGAFNVDLSRVPSNGDVDSFKNDIHVMNQRLLRTGVTSYLATMTSQKPEVYRKMITIAPELPGALDTIRHLTKKGIVASIGHTKASYDDSIAAVQAGARSITHLFNTMCPFHHRDPGPFGTIIFSNMKSKAARIDPDKRPYFGVIADGIHLHPASINLAYKCHPQGLVLVTDANMIAGCEDGVYEWNGGRKIEKRGTKVTLEGTDTIAGSAVNLMDCVNNFINFTGATVAEAISAVTSTPAAMLGISERKGNIIPGSDADLLVLKREDSNRGTKLTVAQVWKFGHKVFDVAESSNGLAAIKPRV